jgi:hypothetical protein
MLACKVTEEDKVESPFFIIGCVRSGTSLLRNILSLHPRLECPAETHLFRWAEPFGTLDYDKFYKKSLIFKQHREEDGIAHFDFHHSLRTQLTRKGMMDWYGREFLRVRNNPKGRWFDKTPQNVYGVLLLAEAYPTAKFLHIVRNPLNVAVSLLKGEVMPVLNPRAAANYWLEAAMILSHYKKLAPERIMEIKYENLLSNPVEQVTALLEFINEQVELFPFRKITGIGSGKTVVRKRKLNDDYSKYLTVEQIEHIIRTTEPYFTQYGYR